MRTLHEASLQKFGLRTNDPGQFGGNLTIGEPNGSSRKAFRVWEKLEEVH